GRAKVEAERPVGQKENGAARQCTVQGDQAAKKVVGVHEQIKFERPRLRGRCFLLLHGVSPIANGVLRALASMYRSGMVHATLDLVRRSFRPPKAESKCEKSKTAVAAIASVRRIVKVRNNY